MIDCRIRANPDDERRGDGAERERVKIVSAFWLLKLRLSLGPARCFLRN